MLNTKDLNYIIEAHSRYALNVDKTARYWDKKLHTACIRFGAL